MVADLIAGAVGALENRKQRKYSHALNTHKIQWTVNDAKKAGISPIYALGSPAAGSWASAPSGTPLSDGISRFSNTLEGRADREQQRAQADRIASLNERKLAKETELIDAQINSMRAATFATMANATRTAQTDGIPNVMPTGLAAPVSGSTGIRDAFTARYPVRTVSGANITMPNDPIGLDEYIGWLITEGRGVAKEAWNRAQRYNKPLRSTRRNPTAGVGDFNAGAWYGPGSSPR